MEWMAHTSGSLCETCESSVEANSNYGRPSPGPVRQYRAELCSLGRGWGGNLMVVGLSAGHVMAASSWARCWVTWQGVDNLG